MIHRFFSLPEKEQEKYRVGGGCSEEKLTIKMKHIGGRSPHKNHNIEINLP